MAPNARATITVSAQKTNDAIIKPFIFHTDYHNLIYT